MLRTKLSPEEKAAELAFQEEHRAELQALFPEWDGKTQFSVFMDNRTLGGWSLGRMYWSSITPAAVIEHAGALIDGLRGSGDAAKPAPKAQDRRDTFPWGSGIRWLFAGVIGVGAASSLAGTIGAPLAAAAVLGTYGAYWYSDLKARLHQIASPAPSTGEPWDDDSQRIALRAYWGDRADERLRSLMKDGWNPNTESVWQYEKRESESLSVKNWCEFRERAGRAVELAEAMLAADRARAAAKEREVLAIQVAREIIHEGRVPIAQERAWDEWDYTPKHVPWQELSNKEIQDALSQKRGAARRGEPGGAS